MRESRIEDSDVQAHCDSASQDDATVKKRGEASMVSSIANLCNTIIGTGMLATPGAFRYTGLLPGIFFIALCGFTAAAGLTLLTLCADTMGGRRNSFFSVAMKTLPRGARWFDVAIAVKCFGVSISYLIICGQLMPQVILSFAQALDSHEHLPDFLLDRSFWIFSFMVFLTPLCFLRRLDSLRHTSYFSLLAVLYLVIIVFYYTLPAKRSHLPPPGPVYVFNIDGHHFLSIFPVFVFAFTCAQNMLPVHNEMQSDTEGALHLNRTRKALTISIALAGSVYLFVGVLGYISFGSNVSDNIIAMYPHDSLFVCFGRVAIVILTFCSYPLQVHPCRAALDKVFSKHVDRQFEGASLEETAPIYHEEDEEDHEQASRDQSGLLHAERESQRPNAAQVEMSIKKLCILTGLILASTFVIALLIDDLSIILGFVGSVGSTTISFILPGTLFAVLHKEGPRARYRRFAQLLAIYGVLVMVLSLAANILKLTRTSSSTTLSPDAKADRIAMLDGANKRTFTFI